MEQDLCSADDLLRGEAPRVTQVAENGLHIKGKMNDGEPPPLTCIPFPAYNVDKGLTPLNNIFCSILHRDLEFTQILGQSRLDARKLSFIKVEPFFVVFDFDFNSSLGGHISINNTFTSYYIRINF